jgi:CRP/FNR family transcriptional regulator, cyclic AMP receptor protein
MENLDERTQKDAQTCCTGLDLTNANTVSGSAGNLTRTQFLRSGPEWNDVSAEWRAGEFYKDLSPKAMSELESVAVPYCCEGTTVLFAEEQEPCSILFLLEGRVKLTMNSIDGKRLTLGIAMPGEILGLAAVVTGCPYEITAVAQFPCRIRALPRKSFLDLLLRYPVACQNSARLLSVEYKRGCEQLRILGLTLTASMKLAKLLLQWCAEGQRTGLGVRVRCSHTHEEIGEYIGLSRETVTRNLTDFRNHDLVEQHGSAFFIPSLGALEIYAGQLGG